jgi:hypothetical protein
LAALAGKQVDDFHRNQLHSRGTAEAQQAEQGFVTGSQARAGRSVASSGQLQVRNKHAEMRCSIRAIRTCPSVFLRPLYTRPKCPLPSVASSRNPRESAIKYSGVRALPVAADEPGGH